MFSTTRRRCQNMCENAIETSFRKNTQLRESSQLNSNIFANNLLDITEKPFSWRVNLNRVTRYAKIRRKFSNKIAP